MEVCIAQQYLARIGYISSPEQQIPEPDPNPRPDLRLATIEGVQAKILSQLQEQHAAQRPAPATISIRAATTQTCTPDICEQAASSSILPDTPSTISATETEPQHRNSEAQHRTSKSRHEHESPPPPTKAETLASLHSELSRRQNICLEIERQVDTCLAQIRTHASKQRKISKQHEKRIAEIVSRAHAEKQKTTDTEERKDADEFEEMRKRYRQYDREVRGAPRAETVDALFVVVAGTEDQLRKADEGKKIAGRREGRLEERLYEARCAMFEMEGLIEEVENGGLAEEGSEPIVYNGRVEGHKEGKGKPRRRKGAKDRRQGKEEGGDEKVGRRRRRRRNISSKAGKMSFDTTLDG